MTPTMERKRIFDTRWLWLLVFLFISSEWLIIFTPDLRSSFSLMRQRPELFPCPTLAQGAALLFFNFKVWVVVSLTQAVTWGVVAYISLHWLGELWRTGEAAGRWRRIGSIGVRSVLFGASLWFFLTPAPGWNLGCFAGRINIRASGVLAYLAVGFATVVMWTLENRVCALPMDQGQAITTRRYLDLRHKLQTLLSMSSLLLAFGVVGLMTRRAFLQPISPASFFPGSIVLEGFEYTVLLALAYAPVHAAFNAVGATLRSALLPAIPPNADTKDIENWARLSSELGDLLQISVYDWKSFGPGFPILAPFLLSLLSGLVRH